MRDIFSLLVMLFLASNLGTLFVESSTSVTNCEDICGIAKEPTFAKNKKDGKSCQTFAKLFPNFCQAFAKLLPNFCQTFAKLLPNFCQKQKRRSELLWRRGLVMSNPARMVALKKTAKFYISCFLS
jgi:hypothetical protein